MRKKLWFGCGEKHTPERWHRANPTTSGTGGGNTMTFVVYMLTAGVLFLAIGFAPAWVDRSTVWAMRSLHVLAFPDAIRLAVSLERDVAEWRFSNRQAEHQQIGDVWIANGPFGTHVDVKLGNDKITWKPNFIERRIIYDAALHARARTIHAQLDKVLPT
jgi:hypothetical protein